MRKIIFYYLVILSGWSCQKEPLDINEFRELDQPQENIFELREQTSMFTQEDANAILEVRDVGFAIDNNAYQGEEIEVGDVLINNFYGENTTPFLKKVVEVNGSGNRTLVRTEDAMMWEAFSYYRIDTRSDEAILTRNNIYEYSYTINNSWSGVTYGDITLNLTPNLTNTVRFDSAASYFTAEWDETNQIPTKVRLEIKSLTLSTDISFTASGKVENTIPAEFEAIPVATIPETPLMIYVEPILELTTALEGEVTTPNINYTYGAYDYVFDYDESREETIITEQTLVDNPAPESSDWDPSGSGSIELKFGMEIFVSTVALADVLKAGVSVFGYVASDMVQKGSFSDPRPRVALGASAGAGVQFSAELTFFDPDTEPPASWIPNGLKLESPDYKAELKKWELKEYVTCTPYPDALLEPDGNNYLIIIQNDEAQKTSYTIDINGQPYNNGATYDYNTPYQISIPVVEGQLVSTIEAKDTDFAGCQLLDKIVDPSLVGNCTEKITDTRDGNEYCIVEINGVKWMSENLRYTEGGSIGAWYNNQDSPDNLIYGRLYTWSEVMNGAEPNKFSQNYTNIRGICPEGWHLPTDQEWDSLFDALGSTGMKYNSRALWLSGDLPEETTFGAVPSGNHYPWFNTFGGQGEIASFWSSVVQEKFGSDDPRNIPAYIVEISALTQPEYGFSSIKNIGLSCRCVKN